MKKEFFGRLPSGEDVYSYTLENDLASLKIMTRGATVLSFKPYGRDIVGGFDTLEDYLKDVSHQGATIGRVANRIADAQFTMDGAIYMVTENDNGNCLHGGAGFDYKNWDVECVSESSITLSYYSADGEEGFPAGLLSKVTFTLDGATLIITYEAKPEGKTPIALTNHSYFNLDGFGGEICDHIATIYADKYTEVNGKLIPNGNRPSVVGTAFDFTEPHAIGERIGGDFVGYDHNFVLAPKSFKEFAGVNAGLAASVENADMRLNVYTDQPGVQFYIGNFMQKIEPSFRGGVKPIPHGAFCLETQTEPNCINHGVGFYDAGDVYTHICVYEVEKK
ncbi:MAG: galactose mutarotase [Clostridia bacterium]|nr:galactose mutarotase [Clostridia bacterium]